MAAFILSRVFSVTFYLDPVTLWLTAGSTHTALESITTTNTVDVDRQVRGKNTGLNEEKS